MLFFKNQSNIYNIYNISLFPVDYDQFREQSVPSQQPIGHPLLTQSTTTLNNSNETNNIQDLDDLFNSLGLNKYTNLFKQQEVSL